VSGSGVAQNEREVEIKVSVPTGQWVRQVGSDIAANEVIVSLGQRVGPTEIGLLATAGIVKIRAYRKPVIGVISTGDELVDPWIVPEIGKIRDSNRITLISVRAFIPFYKTYSIIFHFHSFINQRIYILLIHIHCF
jgi:molybdopterin biosynthesis enzyme